MKCGNLNFLEPSGPLQAYNGNALLLQVVRRPVPSSLKIFENFLRLSDFPLEKILALLLVNADANFNSRLL